MQPSKSEASKQAHASRVKRLLQMMWLMQSATRTSDELATIFGVSSRTIFRDIQLLRESGVEIDSDKTAGYRMKVDMLFATYLEPEELIAFSLLEEAPALANLNGFPNMRAVGLAKLRQGAAPAVRSHVERVLAKLKELIGNGTLDKHDAAAVNVLIESWLKMSPAPAGHRSSPKVSSLSV